MGSVKLWAKNSQSGSWPEVKKMYVKINPDTIWSRVTKVWAKVSPSTWALVFANANVPLMSDTDPITIRTGGYNGPVDSTWEYIDTPLYGHDGTITNYTSITNRQFMYAPTILATQSVLEPDDILNTQSNQILADRNYVWYQLTAWNGSDSFNSIQFESPPIYMIKHNPVRNGSSAVINGTVASGNQLSLTFNYQNYWYNKPDAATSYIAWYRSVDGVTLSAFPQQMDFFSSIATTNNSTSIQGTSYYNLTPADQGYYIVARTYVINSYTDYFNSPLDYRAATSIAVPQPSPTIKTGQSPTLTYQTGTGTGTANQIGDVYRLTSGSWDNNPTRYKYHLEYNDVSGTQFAFYPSDGVSYTTDTFWDYTITSTNANGKTIVGVVTANNGTDSLPTYSNSIGPITYPTPDTPTVTVTSTVSTFTFNTVFGNNTTTVKLEWGTTSSYGSSNTIIQSGTYSPTGPFAIGFQYYWKATPYNNTVAGTPVTGIIYGIPYAPTNLAASQGTYSDRIHLSWTAAAGANNGYQIWYNTTSTGYPSDTAGSYDFSSTNAYYDDYVVSNTTRYYWVRSLNGDKFSAWQPTSLQAGVSGYSGVTPGAFTYSLIDATLTPSWPSGAGINITGSTNNIMTVTWNAALNANGSGINYAYGDQVFGVYNSSLYRTANTSDTWSYSSSGNEYAIVYAFNYNTRVTLAWGASTNAQSYFYYYGDGSGATYSGYTTNTSITFNVAYGNQAVVYGVSAWSQPNGGGIGTGGTLSGSSVLTPTVKSTSAQSGNFFLTYTSAGTAPTTPGTPTLTYINANGSTSWNYSATWTGSTGTAPISYYLKCYGISDNYVSVQTTKGPFSSTSSGTFTLPQTSSLWKVAAYATNSIGTSGDSAKSNSA